MRELDLIVTIIIQLLTAAFVYGRLTERVKSHGTRITKTEDLATRHEGEIGELFGHAGIHRG